jgi:hypothetical protein
MKALALKELREVVGIAAVALAGYLALVVSLMGAKVFYWVPGMPSGTTGVPFADGDFTGFFTWVSVAFATALGFRQSTWESARGTFLFLLHRPVSRRAIFLTKLATGAGVFLLGASLPIVLYALWAAVPGHHPSPFAWSMTGPAWRLAFLMPLLYLGAVLSGLRPARWFGTRLLPLAASATFLVLLNVLPWWWYFSFPLVILLYGLLVANICFVARVRDYA